MGGPILAYVTRPVQVLDLSSRLGLAQRHAATFGGDELANAARGAARLSRVHRWYLIAADQSGERILGAASLLDGTLLADVAQRLDGLEVLVVAGVIAGPLGVAQRAAVARSLGASSVHAAFLGGWAGPIEYCDSVQVIEDRSRRDELRPRVSSVDVPA